MSENDFNGTLASLDPSIPFGIQVNRSRSHMSVQGSHLLSLPKASKMPESSRAYVKGDPIQMIDWQAYARNDQVLIRQKKENAPGKVNICIDLSESMYWPTDEIGLDKEFIQKSECALRVAMHLAYTHLRQYDIVTLYILSADKEKEKFFQWKPRSASELLGIYQAFYAKQFENLFVLSFFEEIPSISLSKTDMVYALGDFISLDLKEFVYDSPIKIVLHMLSQYEVNSKWLQKSKCYFDEKSMADKEYTGEQLIKSIDTQVDEWSHGLAAEFKNLGASYQVFTENSSIQDYMIFIADSINVQTKL